MGYNSGRKFCWTLSCIKGFSSIELFEISHDCVTENACLSFDIICLKAVRNTFSSNIRSVIRGWRDSEKP